MAKKETNKIKAEKLDRLREIFADTYFIQLDSDKFEEIGEFTYKPLLQSDELADAIEFVKGGLVPFRRIFPDVSLYSSPTGKSKLILCRK